MNDQKTAVISQLSDWDIFRHQAETFVKSDLLPKAISNWQKAVVLMQFGKELGMGPMEAIQSIDVIQGKPTQKPQSMKAMVHKKIPNAIFRCVKSTDDECIYEAARPGDPVMKFFFTIKDAERMGLVGKDNWKKQPKVMLNWRCIGHVARTVFPDCLSGVSYTPEEMGADVDDEHNVIELRPTEKAKPKEETKVIEANTEEPPKVETTTTPPKEEDPEPVDTDIYLGTPKQKAHLMALFVKHKIKREDMVAKEAGIERGIKSFIDIDRDLATGGKE